MRYPLPKRYGFRLSFWTDGVGAKESLVEIAPAKLCYKFFF